ncbi:hypothetical protein HGRIS_003010 [Hohenbuehelia grisea]|uniref:PBP domain-containing protein n=1 Tax=Hohenbuehelia grisea TaxID=104357 RepID=A0ABR3JP53_9AGAR
MALLNTLTSKSLVFLVVVSQLIASTRSAEPSPLKPQATYNGGYESATKARLRVANGGAGQSGLIGAFADAFIKSRVDKSGDEPFTVEWYLGDTTQSLGYLSAGYVDVAFTYNEAAELATVKHGKASKRELVFMDHFYLVGPPSNPAGLAANDSVSDMFNKIVQTGNVDAVTPPDPNVRPPTRFLSRFDKSATNIKESEMFIKIGQVPWALAYSNWYHQYPRFPLQALSAASTLDEYTLTDRGTWLSSPQSVTSALTIFARGAGSPPSSSPDDATSSPVPSNSTASASSSASSIATSPGAGPTTDPKDTPERRATYPHATLHSRAAQDASTNAGSEALLNPCNALLGTSPQDRALAVAFMDWLVAKDGGQAVVATFEKNGEVLYEPVVRV